MTTGQPAVGFAHAPPAAVAFGTVTSSGIVRSAVLSGTGLKRVRLRLVGSRPAGGGPAAVQKLVSTALSDGVADFVR